MAVKCPRVVLVDLTHLVAQALEFVEYLVDLTLRLVDTRGTDICVGNQRAGKKAECHD